MTDRRIRTRTRNPELDRLLNGVLDTAGINDDRDLLYDLLVSVVQLGRDSADTLDLKIAGATLREMREAFRTFAPYRTRPKVTIFGSARTRPDDPLYDQARQVARLLAAQGWMVVTGAGPGIMAAGMEGAGQANSFGVRIRLPFEQGANPIISRDDKLVSMKYFFTRKLMLVKESKAFVSLPGGFGTLDETFELLTLTQTGKGLPVPIVFLDVPGGTYWEEVQRFIDVELATRGLVDAHDLSLFLVTDDPAEATKEIVGFYANYDSMRYVGDVLVLRLRYAPDDDQLAALNDRFGHLCATGSIERTSALPEEVADDDLIALPRIKLHFARRYFGQLRELIDALNALPHP
jgi:uncharacterized protein (TIGR00730 family)